LTQKPLYQPWNDEVFRGDVLVQSMSHLQRWMYMSLLHQAFFYSTRPYLPDDDEILWRLAGCPNRMLWDENCSDVKAMFVKTEIDGVKLLGHKRVIEDYERAMEKREQSSEVARRNANARWSKQKESNSHAVVMQPHTDGMQPQCKPMQNDAKGREVKRIEVSQDQKGEAPDSELHPTQYAAKLMEEIRLPHTQANLRVVAAAVTAEAKAGRTMSEAYLWLLDKAKAAQDVGTPIDRFWFEDRKWMRGQVPLKGPCVKHPNSNVTSTGGCWDCYQEANQRGVTVIR
jgi:uncharacterized protein YdaU (DUF1376 family)